MAKSFNRGDVIDISHLLGGMSCGSLYGAGTRPLCVRLGPDGGPTGVQRCADGAVGGLSQRHAGPRWVER